MKRRGFLRLLGAAAVAPVLPAPVAAQAVSYNRYTYGLAVFHARTRAHVSARGLAHCLKVSLPQAEAMIAEMASAGHVTPVLGATGGKVRAVSNILRPDTWGLDRAARRARAETRRARLAEGDRPDTPQMQVDLSAFLAHLRALAANRPVMA